ncbi:VOC family protein [Spongisporangium articulatum]|uniref:VOC family protein n=1 Tax=Spongisporangium articulatum TaxID=3362603 RepID=A0ABW8AQU0_9ACTN
MATRLVSVVIDTPDPAGLAAWWGAALGWPVSHEDGESEATPPAGEPGIDLVFVKVDDPRVERNRVHLDLRTSSPEEQPALVARLLDAGAKRADIGQGDVPWEVLEDPEGNVFCVLEPRAASESTGAVAGIVVEASDPASLGRFWVSASGWKVGHQSDRTTALIRPDGLGPWLAFVASDRPRLAKNRLHLDVAPGPDDDQGVEVARLHALGARAVDVGQAVEDITWVVLADPEDNEFCVLSPR